MTPSKIEPPVFRLVVQYLNQLRRCLFQYVCTDVHVNWFCRHSESNKITAHLLDPG